MIKPLIEHHLEFLILKGGCRGSPEFYTYQNVKLLEISCRGSYIITRQKGLGQKTVKQSDESSEFGTLNIL